VVFCREDLDEEVDKREEAITETEDDSYVNDAAPRLWARTHEEDDAEDEQRYCYCCDTHFSLGVKISHTEEGC